MRTVWMESRSERQRMVNPRKAYPIDTGLIAAFDRHGEANRGHALETAVLIELERRCCEATYVRTREGHEVDFLARGEDGSAELVQVCDDASGAKDRGPGTPGPNRGGPHVPVGHQAPADPDPPRPARPVAPPTSKPSPPTNGSSRLESWISTVTIMCRAPWAVRSNRSTRSASLPSARASSTGVAGPTAAHRSTVTNRNA